MEFTVKISHKTKTKKPPKHKVLKDLVTPHLDISQKDTISSKEIFAHPCLLLFYSQQPKMLSVYIDRWVGSKNVSHIGNRILFSHKQKWNYVFCRKMDGAGKRYTRWSDSDSERQIQPILSHVQSFLYVHLWGLGRKSRVQKARKTCKTGEKEAWRVMWETEYMWYDMEVVARGIMVPCNP